MTETNEQNYLGTGNLRKLMIKYAVPCVISMVVAALYNIVDQIFIANASYLGSYGNAANTVVFPMTVVALAITVTFGEGCCTFVSIRLGAKKKEEANRGVGSTIIAVIASSLILTAIYLVFQEPIINAFGARVNEQTFLLSKEYFLWITLGIPFYMFGQALNPIIRADGSPRFAMMTLVVGAVINIVLDPVFIFVTHWGMKGAAWATDIGQVVAAAMALTYMFRMKVIKLDKDCFHFRFQLIKKITALGMTSFFAQISIVFSMAATINMAVQYGAVDPVFGQAEYSQIPTAIAGIVSKFFQVIISISVGLASGCIPIAGYNIGAGKNDRVLKLMRLLLTTEIVLGLISTAIFLLIPGQLMKIFGSANESVYYTQFGVWFIRAQLCTLPLGCMDKGFFIFLQSLGMAKTASALSVLREFIFGIGFALLLPAIWGLYSLPFFMPAADVFTFIVAVIVLLRLRKRLKGDARIDAGNVISS